MPLADAPNGRIAGHLADGVQILGEQERTPLQARRRRGRLDAGVSAAHHDDVIVLFHKFHCTWVGALYPRAARFGRREA